MKKRNIILEGRIKELLLTADVKQMNKKQQGLFIAGLEKLYQATQDKDYHDTAKKAAMELVDKDGLMISANGELTDNLLGNSLFAVRAADIRTEGKTSDLLSEAVKKQEKVMISGERFAAAQTCSGVFSVKLEDAYYTQPFYMNYETQFGGKEQYNDIIAQFNILHEKSYQAVENALGSIEADTQMALYAAAAIDTMEVMEQPLYEIYDRLRQIFKSSVNAMNKKSLEGFKNEITQAGLFYAYAVLKGCRMKALITEKYEAAAIKVLEAAEKEAENADLSEIDIEKTSVLIMAYAESLRNREYQDYGRTKGGVLWS